MFYNVARLFYRVNEIFKINLAFPEIRLNLCAEIVYQGIIDFRWRL